MTYRKPIVNLTVSSLKGNTVGILEYLDQSLIDTAIRLKNQQPEELKDIWNNSDIILFGISSYSSKFCTELEFPKQINRYREVLESWEGKQIILFGSGRSEYEFFCGAIDYLEIMLGKKNNILFKYKFEGYPKENEKVEFSEKVRVAINGI